jgi:hypothetical protein
MTKKPEAINQAAADIGGEGTERKGKPQNVRAVNARHRAREP